MTEERGSWGGARPGAGNPEFKPKWKSGKTMVIRVPEAIADEVLAIARQIDEGSAVTQSSTQSDNDAVEGETTNAVRQWCVFARHNNGMLQFMGGYWSRADAQSQARKHQQEHHRSESIGDKPYIGAPPVYEVKEMLVAPVELYAKFDKQAPDLQPKLRELEATLTVVRNTVEPLKRENERLREQIREYRKKVEDSAVTQSSEASIEPSTLFNQLRPLLNRLSDRERRAIQQKLEEVLG